MIGGGLATLGFGADADEFEVGVFVELGDAVGVFRIVGRGGAVAGRPFVPVTQGHWGRFCKCGSYRAVYFAGPMYPVERATSSYQTVLSWVHWWI